MKLGYATIILLKDVKAPEVMIDVVLEKVKEQFLEKLTEDSPQGEEFRREVEERGGVELKIVLEPIPLFEGENLD